MRPTRREVAQAIKTLKDEIADQHGEWVAERMKVDLRSLVIDTLGETESIETILAEPLNEATFEYAASIKIPDPLWWPTGEYIEDSEGNPDPKARLHTRILINGTSFHLEAFAVNEAPKSDGWVTLLDEKTSEALCEIMGDDGWPPTLTEIAGRRYALIATPFGN